MAEDKKLNPEALYRFVVAFFYMLNSEQGFPKSVQENSQGT